MYQGRSEPASDLRRRCVCSVPRGSLAIAGGGRTNAQLGPGELKRHGEISREARDLLARVIDHFALTGRGYARTLKVARTIADLEGGEEIGAQHLAEALQYRAPQEGLG